jgi:hypothetical protein
MVTAAARVVGSGYRRARFWRIVGLGGQFVNSARDAERIGG